MPNNPITAAVIAETEKVCAEATPEPWERFGLIGHTGGLCKVRGVVDVDRVGRKVFAYIPLDANDAKFLVHARTWLPIFARTVAEQRQELDRQSDLIMDRALEIGGLLKRLKEIEKAASEWLDSSDGDRCCNDETTIKLIQSLAQEGGK